MEYINSENYILAEKALIEAYLKSKDASLPRTLASLLHLAFVWKSIGKVAK
jgi:hypothetical protein